MKQSSFMKTLYGILLVMTIAACASNPPVASSEMSLDAAIQEAAVNIDGRIEAGTKIALLNFDSPADNFSKYVLDELMANLVDSGKLTIVDRKEVDLIRSEFEFQFSGEVGDDSMQKLGRMLGAQSIVSGSLTKIGNSYRIVVRVLNVQSAAVEVQYRTDIANDSRVQDLLAGGKSGGTATVPGGSGGAAGQAPAQPAGPRNGTYSFWPRPRAGKAGIPVNAYISKIVVSGGYLSVYVVGTEQGTAFADAFPGNDVRYKSGLILQDLDNPAKSYQPATGGVDGSVRGGSYFTFEKVMGKRFALSSSFTNPPTVFEEIALGEPDQ